MPIRMTGINSGLDTDSIVQALVSNYSYKKDKLKKSQTKLSWTQDAWKSLNTKVYSLYSSVSNLRFSSAYKLKKTTSSDPTKATITASNNSANGSQKLNIIQVAQAGYLTGGKLAKSTTTSTTLAELGYTGGDAEISVDKGNGTSKTIKLNSASKVSDVINQLKDAGLNADFDTSNNRFFISAKDTGKDNDFNLVAANGNGADALAKLGLSVSLTTGKTDADGKPIYTAAGEAYSKYDKLYSADSATLEQNIKNAITAYTTNKEKSDSADLQIENLRSGIAYAQAYENQTKFMNDYDGKIGDKDRFNAVVSNHSSKGSSLVDEKGFLYTATDDKDSDKNVIYSGVDKDGNTKYYAKGEGNSYYELEKKADGTYEKKGSSVSGLSTVSEAYDKYKEDLKTATGKTEEDIASELSSYEADLKTVADFAISGDTQALKDIENNGNHYEYSKDKVRNLVENSGMSTQDLIQTFATAMGDLTDIKTEADKEVKANELVKDVSNDSTDSSFKAMVKQVEEAHEILKNAGSSVGAAAKMDGQDAIIKLNGAEFTSGTNSIAVNGLTINAQAVTGDGDNNAITITTATDSQGVYDKIKDFLSEYNNIINEMSKLYNAASSKGFEPLTDEEKDAMSDKEIEKWEEKIKTSLLRRDSTLGGIIDSMSNAMAKGFNINGKTYSLSSFGIKTLGPFNSAANEGKAYHIDGDADDIATSGNSDKLMAMINSDPDTVMDFMQQLTSNLYKTLGDKMQRTNLSSSYTIYNDKQMESQYRDYTKLISQWEERISAKEDRYYKQFAKMETALSKLNSTQSSMGGFFS